LLKGYKNASHLYSGAGVKAKDGRGILDSDICEISNGAIVYDSESTKWFGSSDDIPLKYQSVDLVDLEKNSIILPSFIDCHTHMVFSGDRSSEFSRRCSGATYEEIAAEGGGIATTVESTRKTPQSVLTNDCVERINESQSYGVRALEIKSGYGLSHESEIKCLEAILSAKKATPRMKIQSTYLGAHSVPVGVGKKDYIDEILQRTLPEIAERKLADACDVFVDKGYFDTSDARKILGKARDLGLLIKLHGDELGNTESAELAVELEALSVDHLLKVSANGIKKLSKSETVSVLLPGTAFYLKERYAPARDLIDSGAIVAVATDFNPGSCMCNSLPVMMTLSALYMGMTRAEIFASVTYNAAKALGMQNEIGIIAVGGAPFFNILPFKRFEEVYYRFAWQPA